MPRTAARDIQFQRSKIPEGRGVHPFVKFIWRKINEELWSQEDVAVQSGVSSSAMRKWRLGDRNPRISELEAVINTLGYKLVLKERGE
jgi:transcriptional regulator with XRE-family HTH domain